jgi:hypothetical protein
MMCLVPAFDENLKRQELAFGYETVVLIGETLIEDNVE